MRLKIIFIFLLFNQCCWTQEILWERKFKNEDTTYHNYFSNIQWWSHDEIIVLNTPERGAYSFKIFDFEGNVKRIIQGYNGKNIIGLGYLLRTSNEFVYCGNRYNPPNSQLAEYFLQKMTLDGNISLSRGYSFNSGIAAQAIKLIQTNDKKSFVCAGWAAYQNSSAFYGILKTDTLLNENWFKKYLDAPTTLDTTAYTDDIIENHRGNYLTVGTLERNVQSVINVIRHPFLIEIKPEGDTLQTKELIINKSRREDGRSFGLLQASDLNYVFPIRVDTFMNDTSNHLPDQMGALVKIDTNFKPVWICYLKIPFKSVVPYDAVELSDSSYLVSASIFNYLSSDSTSFNLYKVSKHGIILKEWSYRSRISKILNPARIFLPNDGSAFLTGSCYEYTNEYSAQAYIVRIGNIGNPMYPKERPIPDPILFIPNLITPNGDKENDFFEVRSESNNILSEVKLKIYNQWGAEIFESENYKQNWKAEGLADGVYYYNVEFKNKKYKGWIQVIK